MLYSEQCSCVVRQGDRIEIFRRRGVTDLYDLLHDGRDLLRGAFVADKVVGKGAAALMIAGGVESVFADVISSEALDLFNGCGVSVGYTVAVPFIINRSGTGRCPVETLCSGITEIGECVAAIEKFLSAVKR